jgi:allantoinase
MAYAIRSTRVVTLDGVASATLVVEGERIAEVRTWNSVPAGAELRDFDDLYILPGMVDTHVHINEPGRTEWEGFQTATRAAAAGGVTTLVDMPLNCVPETISAESLQAKRRAAEGKAWVDWAAWGGVVRGNSENLKPLAHAGVPGFKCFLIHSGIDGFAWVDESELRLALATLRGTGLPLLAHAEMTGPVEAASGELNARNGDWRAYPTYLASRPDAAEVLAIELLIRLGEEFQTPIHIVHLASARALPMLAEARRRGAPITVETCPHYLWFSAEQIPAAATEYKCAPPIRSAANREALWTALLDGTIDLVATDHSPCPPELKKREEGRWDLAWGGIASLGLALPVMWAAMHKRNVGLERVAEWMAAAPACLAGFSGRKGCIAAGADADLVAFDPNAEWTVTADELKFRHKISPYLGAKVRGRVIETWLRGRPVFRRDGLVGEARGRELVRQ